ncbi:hypothetical protein CWI38_0515p0030 [Hamiltosporidium tvaerminnensis]|uniref:Uncharacterized protein n=1 Tax=Hamiltosporidium tvaerminnensis TaxID=1176355 RepID=A0A4Q9LWM6_9MICR|nr:hypothetical protein CWI38_0515p0030 [Hamiltosporidium tvaerminnensis]
MYLPSLNLNRLLFILTSISDILYIIALFRLKVLVWYILIPLIVLQCILKMYLYLVCFVTINRKYLTIAIVSLIVSVIENSYLCVRIFFIYIFFVVDVIYALIFYLSFVFFCLQLLLLINCVLMKKILMFDVSIPVSFGDINFASIYGIGGMK